MTSRLLIVARALGFVILALVLCAIVFEFAGYSSVLMFQSIVAGAFASPTALLNSTRWALPLFVTAAGVVISFRCGYFNVGAQGQFYVGAIGAAFAVQWLNGLPATVVVPVAVIAGIVGGMLWSAWPGVLRIREGTDEVVTTLMANFIASIVLIYVTSGPLKDPSGTGQVSASRPIAAIYRISGTGGVSPILLALVIATAIVVWMLVNRTSFGVLSSLAGRNPVMVAWQGARIARLGLASFLLSGAFAGLAGAMEFLGPDGRLVSGFSPALGFTAIVIALVAGLSVGGVVVVSLFFGGLAAASLYLPVIAGLPAAAIDMINAAIALFITGRALPYPRWLLAHRRWLRLPRRAT